MKIIDKTPLQDENGQIGLINRIQGMLKYGMSWPAELDAQKKVIAQLDRVLEKGFVLIRNFTLPNSEIVIPMIVVGPGGVTVIYVTTLKGFFEAKGDQWNTVVNGRSQPANINLLNRVSRYARAVQVYLERQNVIMVSAVEPVLIAADPGAHVESMRPIARVVMSDAIKQFGNSLLQARPIWRPDNAYSIADLIIEPRPPQASAPAAPLPPQQPAQQEFGAPEHVEPFGGNDLGFSFDEDEQAAGYPAIEQQQSSPHPAPRPAQPQQKGKKILGLTTSQLTVLGVLFLCEICVVIGFLGFYLTNP